MTTSEREAEQRLYRVRQEYEAEQGKPDLETLRVMHTLFTESQRTGDPDDELTRRVLMYILEARLEHPEEDERTLELMGTVETWRFPWNTQAILGHFKMVAGATTLTHQEMEKMFRHAEPRLLDAMLQRRKGGLQFSEECLIAAVGNHEEDIWDIMLKHSGGDLHITEKVVLETIKSSRDPSIELVRKLLRMSGGWDAKSAQTFLSTALQNTQEPRVYELFRAMKEVKGPETLVTTDLLCDAAKCGDCSVQIVEFLLEQMPPAMWIPQMVLVGAASNSSVPVEVLRLLLSHGGGYRHLYQPLILVAALNRTKGDEVLEYLFSREWEMVHLTDGLIAHVRVMGHQGFQASRVERILKSQLARLTGLPVFKGP